MAVRPSSKRDCPFDRQLVAAHEIALDRWEDEESLAEPVVYDPMYRPLAPSDAEEEFYEERRRVLQEVEMIPVRPGYEGPGRGPVVDWIPATG